MFVDKCLTRPPVGIVQREAPGFIDWAPGNGCAYRLLVQWLPQEVGVLIGGSVLVSIENRYNNTFTSYAMNLLADGVYSLDFVEKKFKARNDSLFYVTALINWALYGVDSVGGQYAQEIFDEAKERWEL